MKIEIGGLDNPKPGYKQVDILDRPGVDYVTYAWDLEAINDEAVEEIYARHVFEHFSPREGSKSLMEWLRVLKPGGRLHLIMPNLEYHIRQFNMPGQSRFIPVVSNREHAMYSIFGWQMKGSHMAHKWGYTRQTLHDLLKEHGFVEIQFQNCRECDLEVVAYKSL